MPVVPYSSVPHVNPTPLQAPRISPAAPTEAFGGGIAAERGTLGDLSGVTGGVERIADESHRIALQAKQEADQVAFTHAYGALTNGVTDLLHGPNGVLNKKGADSFTAPEDVQDGYAEMVKGIRDGLGSDTQREVFDKAVSNEWARVNEQTQQHVAQQRAIYDAQGTDALIEAKRVEAVKSYQNPDVVDAAIETQQAAVADHLRRNGAPEELITNKQADVASATRFDVLQQMVDNKQDLAAKAYLDKYHDEFVGRNLTQAETLVNRASVEGEGIRNADIITGVVPTPQGSPVQAAATEDQAMREAAKIQDPQVREKTEQRIGLYFNRKNAAIRQAEEDAYLKGHALVVRSGGDLSSVPTSLAIAMGPHYMTLMGESKRIQTAEDPGDQEQVATLRNEAYFNPETFAARDLTQEKGLSPKQLQTLQTLQRTVGGRQVREEEAPYRAEISRAQADGHRFQVAADKAKANGDTAAQAENERLATEADLRWVQANDALAEHRAARAQASKTTTGPTASSPAPSTGNIDLQAKSPLTQAMVRDVAARGPVFGAKYAQYLDSMQVDTTGLQAAVKAHLAAIEAEKAAGKPAPAKKKGVTIKRDDNGRAVGIVPEE